MNWRMMFLFFSGVAQAETTLSTPYIDQLKREMGADAAPPTESYTESLKRKMESERGQPESSRGYSEYLKNTDPLKKTTDTPVPSYSETEKGKLAPEERGSAIQAVYDGRSDLSAKIDRTGIHRAFGFRYGASLSRDFTANSDYLARNFNDTYGRTYAPDLSFFYEFQPFHSEWFGNFGIVGMWGFSFFQGKGQFAYAVPNPSGGTFSSESNTKFKFIIMPFTVGLNYRFNLLRYVRPYIFVGPSSIVYVETRDDVKRGNRGHSEALLVSVGASFLLDWINSSSSTDLYTTHGIKHYYINLEYIRVIPVVGEVSLGMSGLVAGLTFEY